MEASLPAPSAPALDLPKLSAEGWLKLAIYAATCAAIVYLLYRFLESQAEQARAYQDQLLEDQRAAQAPPAPARTTARVPITNMNGHAPHATEEVEEVAEATGEPTPEPEPGTPAQTVGDRPVTEGNLEGPVG